MQNAPTMEPATLPHGFTEPLRVLESSPWNDGRDWLMRALVLLMLVVLVRCWWWWRSRRVMEVPDSTPVALPARAPAQGIVEQVRASFDGTGRYREGCHALAAAVRGHFDDDPRTSLVSRTAHEIAVLVHDERVVNLFERLSTLQFRRRPPNRRAFLDACDQAHEVVTVEGRP